MKKENKMTSQPTRKADYYSTTPPKRWVIEEGEDSDEAFQKAREQCIQDAFSKRRTRTIPAELLGWMGVFGVVSGLILLFAYGDPIVHLWKSFLGFIVDSFRDFWRWFAGS